MSSTASRRDFISGAVASAIAAPAVIGVSPASHAAPLPPLPNLGATDAVLLQPADRDYARYLPAFNKRTMLDPALRAMCKTPKSVATMVDWCRTNNLPFALRSGGHSYEGFSESASVVIDTRLMADIKVDTANRIATVGAGASLGAIYRQVAPHGLALAAGSCPTVGVSGHTLGGGFGFLGRRFGLTCDNLLSLDLVDPHANMVTVDASSQPDLFWACRGGGGGSFGAVNGFRFALHPIGSVVTFGISWRLSPARAAKLMKVWQAWAPQAPNAITSIFRFGKVASGKIDIRCAGQSTGTKTELNRELKGLLAEAQPTSTTVTSRSFFGAVDHFSGGWDYESTYSKEKSDYVMAPLSDDGLAAFMNGVNSLSAGAIVVICDSYGGAVYDTASDATAFAHRKGTLFCIQYATNWDKAGDTLAHLKNIRDFYASLRPYVSGAAYVNYCDLDLTDWANAYWGANLARLRTIKAAFDPDNVFRHAQSIPVA